MGPARLHKILGHPVLRRQTEKKILNLQIALTIPGGLYLFVMTGKLAHSPTFSVSFPLINAYKTVTYMQRLESVKWQPSHTLLKHLFSITFCSVVSNRTRPSDSKGRQQLSSRISFRKHKEIKTHIQARTHIHTHTRAGLYTQRSALPTDECHFSKRPHFRQSYRCGALSAYTETNSPEKLHNHFSTKRAENNLSS